MLFMLSPRERAVLALLSDGLSHKAAAARLGISSETAKDYSSAARRKLQARNTVHAAAIAARQGLI